MQAMKNLDMSRFQKPMQQETETSRKSTRWQDTVATWLVEFGIQKGMHPFVWKKIGKGGKNFQFMEFKVASIKEKCVYYKSDLKNSAGEFINIIKSL